MPSHTSSTFLLASPDPALLGTMEPLLLAAGARAAIVLSAEAALASLAGPNPPGLLLIDASLPGMPMGRLLATARAQADGPRLPIVLIADTVTQEWIDRLAEGALDDLILRSAEPAYWQLRIDLVLRGQRMAHELDSLRDAAIRNAQFDRLTGVYNRETLLAMLFRETDRVQRMNSSMALVLFDIDDFATGTRASAWTPAMRSYARWPAAPAPCCAATICWAGPAWTRSLSRCPPAPLPTPWRLPSVFASKSSLRRSTWPAKPFASPLASASPTVAAAHRWWSCARPKKLWNGPRPPGRNLSSASAASRNPRRRRSHSSHQPLATNCWLGSRVDCAHPAQYPVFLPASAGDCENPIFRGRPPQLPARETPETRRLRSAGRAR